MTMVRTIKVYRLGLGSVEIEEMDTEGAEGVLREAYNQGNLVIDKETGDIVEEITSNIKEIFVVGAIEGG